MVSRNALFRPLLVIAVLLIAALACNLQVGDNQSSGGGLTPTVARPTVQIVDPAEGARFTKGQTVSVRAVASGASGVTAVRLSANGVEVDSQTPAEQINPTNLEVLLDFNAQQAGTITLAVTAYTGTVAGQPVLRTIQVIDPLNPGAGGAGTPVTFLPPTPTQYNPLCRARVNTGLNFRRGPGTTYDKINTITAGQELPISAYSDQPDGRWWQVTWTAQSGWISAAYTTQLGDCGAIRPGIVPPSPTPVPSVTPLPTQPGTTATPTLPDLFLTALDGVSEVTLGTDGKAVATYTVRVKNGGGQASIQFVVAVGLPNGQVQLLDVPGLNPGQEFQVPSTGLNVTFESPGLARIIITADSNNTVPESNESNNQAYKDINVKPNPNPTAPPLPTSTPQPTDTPPVQSSNPAVAEAIPQIEANANPVLDPNALAALPGIGGAQPITAANAAGATSLAVLQGHGGTVDGLAFSPDGSLLVSASLDGTARLWEVASGTAGPVLSGHTDRVTAVAFSPDGSRVASASWDGTVRLWDAATGAQVGSFAPGIQVNTVDFSVDGTLLAAGGLVPTTGTGLALVWDIASGTSVSEIPTAASVSGVSFLGSARLAVATNAISCSDGGGGVDWFDVPDSGVSTPLSGDSGWINTLAINLNGTVIAGSGQQQLCAGNGTAWVWDTASDALVTALDHGNSSVNGLAFSPDGSLLATGSGNSAVRLWDVAAGTSLATLSGHTGEVMSMAFSPDGIRFASGGVDGTVRLWGVP